MYGWKHEIVKILIGKGATNFKLGLRAAHLSGHTDIVNLFIKKGTVINFTNFKKFGINDVIHAMLYSSKIFYDDKFITLNETVMLYLNENPKDDEIKELLQDYLKQTPCQLWKPTNIRHALFPKKIKQKILRPLLWIIINQFIKI